MAVIIANLLRMNINEEEFSHPFDLTFLFGDCSLSAKLPPMT